MIFAETSFGQQVFIEATPNGEIHVHGGHPPPHEMMTKYKTEEFYVWIVESSFAFGADGWSILGDIIATQDIDSNVIEVQF